jgi:DNA repair protein RecO (recombination protein O)
MAETILTGYLINKVNYDVFDEIITFLIPNGKKITCISKGSKKIESKNARNLFLGALIEFEIFQSRSEDKMSKLKKAHLTEKSD